MNEEQIKQMRGFISRCIMIFDINELDVIDVMIIEAIFYGDYPKHLIQYKPYSQSDRIEMMLLKCDVELFYKKLKTDDEIEGYFEYIENFSCELRKIIDL